MQVSPSLEWASNQNKNWADYILHSVCKLSWPVREYIVREIVIASLS